MRRDLAASFVSWFVALLAAGLLLAVRSPAQCVNLWAPTAGLHGPGPLQGPNGTVFASTLWDPDGAGPAPQLLVVGGTFTLAGSVAVQNVAAFDPLTGVWTAMGGGVHGGASVAVRAFTVLPNGHLVVAGQFTTAGGSLVVNNIARWDGASWSAFGSGTNNLVVALVTRPNGDLLAGGFFTSAGGAQIMGLARWDGSTWSSFGNANAWVRCFATFPNGDLVVGGDFSLIGGVLASRLALWNGTTWSAMGVGSLTSVSAVVVTPAGTVVAGGAYFGSPPGTGSQQIAEWNGVAWQPIAPGIPWHAFSLSLLPNGDVVAGLGQGPDSGVADCLVRRVGTTWVPFSIPVGSVYSLLVMPGGSLVAGGWFGATRFLWSVNDVPGVGIDGRVTAALTAPDGTLVIGGQFTAIDDEPMAHIATRATTDWCPLGTGMDGNVTALARAANGDILAGGDFLVAGGVVANHVARWDGVSWLPLGNGLAGPVRSLAVLPNGDVVAGGSFTMGGPAASNIARWNGVGWTTIGGGLTGGPAPVVNALVVLPNGILVAGGRFTTTGGGVGSNIAQWDGTNWSPVGFGTNAEVSALVVLPNGGLVAGGWFLSAGGVPASRVAQWNGTAWSPLGAGVLSQHVAALAALPDGDLVAAGSFQFAGSVSASNIARWNGANWSAFETGLDGPVACLAYDRSGDLMVGGGFGTAGVWVAPNLARLTTTCPAATASVGNGCPGSGGASVLAAATLPWVESTFRSCGSGLPACAIVVAATSFTSIAPGVQPLSNLFPQAGVGCDLLVGGDILQVYTASVGCVSAQLYLPAFPPLVGLSFYQQMIPFEFDAQGAWVSVTATNALRLTVGAF